ncbi:unnamed protein product [Schistosoma margrebowiei]|uniref:Uncharacterized protein n=1 Tax=Schistosoma margrebowiei TaxID=48269 RepID=A0A183L8T6_9TREM|nr:unnamed protein product [Schistosoma margrebowiei]
MENIINEEGASDADVKATIAKASTAFLQLKKYMELKTALCQPISKLQSSIRASRQFYYMELKLRELLQPSSKMYKYL